MDSNDNPIYVENRNHLFCILDPSSWTFKLCEKFDEIDADFFIKELSDIDLLKLRLSHGRKDLSERKFPIFVKENRPNKDIYTAVETLPEFLSVSTSKIPGAGLGVFTKIDLPVGVVFGPYGGFVTESGRFGLYSWSVKSPDFRRRNIDAKNPKLSNWMRCVNCNRNDEEQNLKATIRDTKIYYFTIKPVQSGSELLVFYGMFYARFLNENHMNANTIYL